MRKKHSVMLIAVLAIILCLTMAFGITAFADGEESVGNPETPVETVVEQGSAAPEIESAPESAQTDNAPQDNAPVQEAAPTQEAAPVQEDPQAEQQTPASDAPAEEAQQNEQEPGQEPVPEADVTETELPTQPTDEEPSQEPAEEAAGEPAEQQDEENPAGEEPANPDAEEISAESASESTDGSPELPDIPVPVEEITVELPEGSSPKLIGENSDVCYAAQFFGLNDSVATLTGGEEADLAELVKSLGYEGEIESAVSSNPEAFDIADGKLRILSSFTDETLTLVINGQEVVICVHDPEAVTESNIVEKFTINGGDYILNEDIFVANGSLIVPTGVNVVLDLNGHVLCGWGTSSGQGSVITVNGSLTLKDSQPNAAHTNTSLPAGGVITGGDAKYGGGVYIGKDATFTMNGGSITANIASHGIGFETAGEGGGVYNDKAGTFIMNGGSISGNSAGHDAAGVFNSGTITMNGGSISGNITVWSGGGVYNYLGTIIMNGGSISGNDAGTDGGGVCNWSTFTMNGGTITGNSAGRAGGGMWNEFFFTMNGGSITVNSANQGGGVYCRTSFMTVGGDAKITGNTLIDKETANNLFLADYPVGFGTGDNAPKDGMIIGVTTSTAPAKGAPVPITKEGSGAYAKYFRSDTSAYIPMNKDGKVQLIDIRDLNAVAVNVDTGELYESVNAAINDSKTVNGNTVKMMADSGENVTVGSGKDVILDLAGHVLKGTGSGSVITVSGGTFTLKDSAPTAAHTGDYSSLPAGGVIKGGYAASGGGVSVGNGSFIMNGGTITQNTATNFGGGVCIGYHGKFTMTDGTISGNASQGGSYGYGGGVFFNPEDSSYAFDMTGGIITNNTAVRGGGVFIALGEMTVSGTAKITNNTATLGGGLFVEKQSSSSVTLGGSVQITGNTANGSASNLYLDDGMTVKAGTDNTALTSEASIGVSTYSVPVAGRAADVTSNGSASDKQHFTSDNTNFSILYETNANGTNVMRLGIPVAQIGTTTDKQYSSVQKAINAAADNTETTVKMIADSTENLTVGTAKKIILDLNGKVLNGGNSGSVITISSGATLTLMDTNPTASHTGTTFPAGGVITGGNATYGGGVYVNNGTFTMNGGSISKNTATDGDGGGVYVYTGSFTMTSGSISGNNARGSYGGGGVFIEEGTFTMSGGNISENKASSCYGGGGVFNYNGTFTMKGGNISENEGSSYGGGVLNFLDFTMDGGSISKNTATNGGGVYVNSGTFTMNSGNISNNTATDGGGVANDGTFKMSNGEISGNTAGEKGGGVYSYKTFTMRGGVIKSNNATKGGGIYNAGTAGIAYESSVTGNSAVDGAGIYNAGTATVYSGTIAGNAAAGNGGGIYHNSGTFTVQSATISGNNAMNGGGAYAAANLLFIGTKIDGNTAIGNGGGIYAKASVGFSNATLSECSAKNGGGVYVENGGRFETSGGKAEMCSAENGGAVYVENDATATFANNISITGNNATVKGGAVYSAGAVGLESATVSSNTATGNGGGIYLDETGIVFAGKSAKVTDNKKGDEKNNLFLADGAWVKIGTGEDVPAPEKGMSIGVTLQNGTGNVTGTNADDYSNHFFSDNTSYKAVSKNNIVQLCTPVNVPTAETNLVYNGAEQTGVKAGTGYTLTNNAGKDAGNYSATANLIDYYCWSDGTTVSKAIPYQINAKELNSSSIGDIAAETYSGSSVEPVLVVKDGEKVLTKGTDYEVSYSGNVNAGTATAAVSFKGNYTGTGTKTFTINAKELNSSSIDDIAEQTYSGNYIEPDLVIKDGEKELAKGVDYEVTYSGNMNAGTATAAVSFKGNYSGNASKNFLIAPKAISVTGTTVEDKIYDGTTDATVIVGIISGVIAGDDVTVAATGTFDTAEIGTGKTVTVVYSFSGTAKDNYVFSVPSELLTASISRKTDPNPDPTPDPVVSKAIVKTTDRGATALAEVKGTTAQIFAEGRNGEIIDPMNVTILGPAELIAMGAKTAEIRMSENLTVVLDIEAAMCGKVNCVITIDNIDGSIIVACDGVRICEADFTDIAESIVKLVYDGKTFKAYDAQGNLIREYEIN